jgi:hypothetical protein
VPSPDEEGVLWIKVMLPPFKNGSVQG